MGASITKNSGFVATDHAVISSMTVTKKSGGLIDIIVDYAFAPADNRLSGGQVSYANVATNVLNINDTKAGVSGDVGDVEVTLEGTPCCVGSDLSTAASSTAVSQSSASLPSVPSSSAPSSAIGSTPNWPSAYDSSLVKYYRMEEIAGDVLDEVSQALDAVNGAGVVYQEAGARFKGINLGPDAEIAMGDLIGGSTSFAFSSWIDFQATVVSTSYIDKAT